MSRNVYVDVVNNVTLIQAEQINSLYSEVAKIALATPLSDFKTVTVATGNYTYTDSSEPLQIFDCDGSNRTITLPILASSNHPFCVVNSTSSGLWTITLLNPDLSTVAEIMPGTAAMVVSNGSNKWFLVGTTDIYVKTAGDEMTGNLKLPTLSFDTVYSGTGEPVGTMKWNADRETVDLIMPNNVTLQFGQELHFFAKNQTGSTIQNGKAVMFDGALGASGILKCKLAIADGTYPATYMMGIATQDIANGADGKITFFGELREVNTSAYTAGDILYLDPTTPGALTKIEPTAPNLKYQIAAVENSHATQGTIFVRAIYSMGLSELNDVQINSVTNGQILAYNSSAKRWENSSLSTEILTDSSLTGDGTSINPLSVVQKYLLLTSISASEAEDLTDGGLTTLHTHAGLSSIANEIKIAIAQNSHGFTTGKVVYYDGYSWSLAKADAISTIGTHIVEYIDENTFYVIQAGSVTWTHGFTVGAWLYTSSSSAGALTEIEPGISNPIAQAISSTKILVFPYRATSQLPSPIDADTLNGYTDAQFRKTADPLNEAALSFSNVTTLNADTSKHGFAPIVTAPASGLLSVLGVGNGETVRTDKALFDTTNPAALGSVSPGTQVIAARRDHVHAIPSHTALSDIGTRTHAAIDSVLNNLAAYGGVGLTTIAITAATGTFENTSWTVTLPAGTYIFIGQIRSTIEFSAGTSGTLRGRMWNNTTGATYSGSEIIMTGTDQVNHSVNSTSGYVLPVVLTDTTQLTFQVGRFTATTWVSSSITNDTNGRSKIIYIRLA